MKLINAQRLKYLKAPPKPHPKEVVGFIYGVMTSSVYCKFCLNRNTQKCTETLSENLQIFQFLTQSSTTNLSVRTQSSIKKYDRYVLHYRWILIITCRNSYLSPPPPHKAARLLFHPPWVCSYLSCALADGWLSEPAAVASLGPFFECCRRINNSRWY